jgi:hypothetical protein
MRYVGLFWVLLIATMFDCFIYIPSINNKKFEYKIFVYSRFEVFIAVGKKEEKFGCDDTMQFVRRIPEFWTNLLLLSLG